MSTMPDRIVVRCHCGQRMAVKQSKAGSMVACPSCNSENLIPEDNCFAEEQIVLAKEPGRAAKIASTTVAALRWTANKTAIAWALIALGFSVLAYREAIFSQRDIGGSTPQECLVNWYAILRDAENYQSAQAAYHSRHRHERFRTLEISETKQSGDFSAIFYRYSIGSDVFREFTWSTKIDGKWYMMTYIGEYSAPNVKGLDQTWFLEMNAKREQWVKNSAKRPF